MLEQSHAAPVQRMSLQYEMRSSTSASALSIAFSAFASPSSDAANAASNFCEHGNRAWACSKPTLVSAREWLLLSLATPHPFLMTAGPATPADNFVHLQQGSWRAWHCSVMPMASSVK